MQIKAIYDSGSNVSLLNQRIADLLKLNLVQNKNAFKTLNGFNFSTARAKITLKIGKITENLNTICC